MDSGLRNVRAGKRIAFAIVVGVIIAAVDNYAFGGEVSPVVVVALLLAATGIVGYLWGIRGALAAVIIWAFIPGLHLVNLSLELPDSLHPHTYQSALKLGVFTAVVAAFGATCGAGIRRLSSRIAHFPGDQA